MPFTLLLKSVIKPKVFNVLVKRLVATRKSPICKSLKTLWCRFCCVSENNARSCRSFLTQCYTDSLTQCYRLSHTVLYRLAHTMLYRLYHTVLYKLPRTVIYRPSHTVLYKLLHTVLQTLSYSAMRTLSYSAIQTLSYSAIQTLSHSAAMQCESDYGAEHLCDSFAITITNKQCFCLISLKLTLNTCRVSRGFWLRNHLSLLSLPPERIFTTVGNTCITKFYLG